MARNGSGIYSAPAGSWNPAVNATPATLADWQALLNDLVAAMTQSVSKDGQTAMTGNLNLGNNKLTNVAAGTVAGDAVNYTQLFTSGVPAVVTSINGGQVAGNRNKIINGDMQISQRGTSFPAITGFTYSLDRFLYNTGVTTAVHTISQSTDVPSYEFLYSLRAQVTTSDYVANASDFCYVSQIIEGYNSRDLTGVPFTLSFWVRGAKTGTHCVAFRNSGLDRSYLMEYTLNAINTWEYKQLTVASGLPTGGTWNYDNGKGLEVVWPLLVGSTYQNTANTWQTGNYLTTSNQVNECDTIGNIFAITGVQLERGTVATPFEHLDRSASEIRCYRYFENIGITWGNQTPIYTQAWYKVNKRAAPISANVKSGIPPTGFAIGGGVQPQQSFRSEALMSSGSSDMIIAVSAEL